MSIINIAGIRKHSFVDGEGIRLTVFTQGCPHACPHCHNPETWDPAGGVPTDTISLIDLIGEVRFLDGITISGGEPLLQHEAVTRIAKAAR